MFDDKIPECQFSLSSINHKLTSHAESLSQHSHLHHFNHDWYSMGILSNLYKRVPQFHKQNYYHTRPWNFVDDVDGLIDSAALAYQYGKNTTSQDDR